MTAVIMRVLATFFLLWPASVFAQGAHLTLRSWTACPTIEHTNERLVFDGLSAVCEEIKAGSLMIVEIVEQVPARRWLCIDHPAGRGMSTLCNWETFQDEPKKWLCVRSPAASGPCKWGPAEYFTGEAILAAVP